MPRYECFLLEPTMQAKRYLRRYSSGSKCPGPMGYHNARTRIEDGDIVEGEHGYRLIEEIGEWPHADKRWPLTCEGCDYTFTESDSWQLFSERVYSRVDTGGYTTIKDAPPGAMWDAPWMRPGWEGPDGLSLTVKLPNNTEWLIDGPANNCTMPDRKHNCWVREGIPPRLTILGGANICGVGGGSIQSGSYHGFLRNGFLED